MSRDGLGEFERRVLLAILSLSGQGYAVSIANEVKARSGKSANLGAVYATVDRLERKRFVSSRLGDPTPERGGKPKRLYSIEALGRMILTEVRDAELKLWSEEIPAGIAS